jgi:hypothetical protein
MTTRSSDLHRQFAYILRTPESKSLEDLASHYAGPKTKRMQNNKG